VLIIGPLMAIYCNDKFPSGPTAEYFESITAIIRGINWEGELMIPKIKLLLNIFFAACIGVVQLVL